MVVRGAWLIASNSMRALQGRLCASGYGELRYKEDDLRVEGPLHIPVVCLEKLGDYQTCHHQDQIPGQWVTLAAILSLAWVKLVN